MVVGLVGEDYGESEVIGLAFDRLRGLLGRRLMPRRRRHVVQVAGPVCRLDIKLQQLPQVSDAAAGVALLRGAPGVVDVHADARGRRIIVLHDSRTSVAELWNWLRIQPGPPP